MATFTATYSSGTCPGCKKGIAAGQVVEYLPPGWPHEYMTSATKSRLWHVGCGSQALRDALCSVCHMLHDGKDGSCLL